MTTLVLDTYAVVKTLRENGYTPEQAEGFIAALEKVDTSNITTKQDLKDLELRIMIRIYTALLAQAALIVTLGKLL